MPNSLRIIHTSDWHLGRRLRETSLVEDQAHAMEQVFAACRDEKADALVIAGDIYDRAVPPEEADELFSGFLSRMAGDLAIPVVVISGNHDSAERLGFGADLLARSNVHLRTRMSQIDQPVQLERDGERASFYCLPYLEPDVARDVFAAPTLRTHDEAVRAATARIRQHPAQTRSSRTVLVGHLFAQGGSESTDSERPFVGGAAHVTTAALDGFSYVALGHLHQPQLVNGRNDVRYSGSLLKYSFAESSHCKGLSLVELGDQVIVRAIPLSPRHDLVRLEGTFEELLKDPRFDFAHDCYVEATWTDTGYLIDVATRLRARFPLLLSALPKVLSFASSQTLAAPRPQLEEGKTLLESFWNHVGQEEPLEQAHVDEFERAVAGVLRTDLEEAA